MIEPMTTPLVALAKAVEALQHLMGFAIVLVTLFVLWGVTQALGAFFRNQNPAPAPSAAMDPEGTASVTEDTRIPEEEVAAVAAVVTLMLGQRHRIVSIRPGNRDWSREGRRQHFASHKIR